MRKEYQCFTGTASVYLCSPMTDPAMERFSSELKVSKRRIRQIKVVLTIIDICLPYLSVKISKCSRKRSLMLVMSQEKPHVPQIFIVGCLAPKNEPLSLGAPSLAIIQRHTSLHLQPCITVPPITTTYQLEMLARGLTGD